MFAECGSAPICIDLDFDTYEGPWQHVHRFRNQSGWMMIAECTIQSEHDMLTQRLTVACEECGEPVPSFQARHLTECDWSNPITCYDELPEILDDLLCEEEGALIVRWHREKNAALAHAFDDQEARIETLEAKVKMAIRLNERRAAELRQRRRHPLATQEMRNAMAEIIRQLDEENDALIMEMAETRRVIRDEAERLEERLWARNDLLVETNVLQIIRWRDKDLGRGRNVIEPRFHAAGGISARRSQARELRKVNTERNGRLLALEEDMRFRKSRATQKASALPLDSVPAKAAPPRKPNSNHTAEAKVVSHPSPDIEIRLRMRALQKEHQRLFKIQRRLSPRMSAYRHNLASLEQVRADLAKAEAEMAALKEGASAAAPKHGAEQERARDARNSEQVADLSKEASRDQPVSPPPDDSQDDQSSAWTYKRVELLKTMWLAGESASTIAKALGNVSRNAVIGKAERLKLPRTRGPNAPEYQHPKHEDDAATGERITCVKAEADNVRWTEERIATLRRMWIAGHSAVAIGNALGGIPKNAVIGKAHRLGLSTEARPKFGEGRSAETPSSASPHEAVADVQPAAVQNALAALSAARKRYYGQD